MTLRTFRLLRSAAIGALASLLLSACGGGGGNPPPASVTISGRITYDRIPFDATFGNGLNPAATVELPARQVTVQAISGAAGAAVLASTTSDTNGNYSLSVPSNTNLFIRARAEMVKTGTAPTWNFSVRNNANSDALYALDGSVLGSGTANSTRNLRAPTGFGATSYTGERAAAPFAILDTVFRAKELVLTATPNAAFSELRLFWSDENKPVDGPFCPDSGDIGTSVYIVFGTGDTDDCGQPGATGIYILGSVGVPVSDTDEFDESVIAHEFGHYLEDRFGRSDSIGGIHGGAGDLLDLRTAFGEGWGNAFSGMVLGSAIYRDSFDGVLQDFHFDLETDDQAAEGWFSEASVGEILWDLFDATNDPGDTLTLGFAPLFAVMTGAEVTTDALTSIYTFSNGLRAANPGSATAIDTLLTGEDIFGSDDFGAGESNDAGDAAILPVYKTLLLKTPINVCSRSTGGTAGNKKLGNRVLLRFDNSSPRLVTIEADGTAAEPGTTFATDPDIYVFREGGLVTAGIDSPSGQRPHTTAGQETIEQFQLPQGTFIIEVYDFELDLVAGSPPRCMTVSVTGA